MRKGRFQPGWGRNQEALAWCDLMMKSDKNLDMKEKQE